MRTFACVLSVLLVVMGAGPRVAAQGAHAAPPSSLDAAVQQHVNAATADADVVRQLLDRADVKAVAAGAGIDIHSATTAVSAMSGQELSGVAAQARAIDQALAGGQSKVTINTTLLIIGLLVLILLIVALK